jgi:hypothetical protein
MQSARALATPLLPYLTLSVLAGCSTTYFDLPIRPDASDDGIAMLRPQADLPGSSARAGFRLVLAVSAPEQPLSLYLDGQLMTAVPISAPGAPEWGVSYGQLPDGSFGTVPGGFPDGLHTLGLLDGNGQTVLTTLHDFAADAWNLLYVFGPLDHPSFAFVTDRPPASSSVSRVRIVNLVDTQEPLILWRCDVSGNCQKLTDALGYGSSWSEELSTDVSAVQFSWQSILELGLGGTCPLPSDHRDAVRHCVVLNSAQHFDGPGSL